MNEIIILSNTLRDKNVPVSIRATVDAFSAYELLKKKPELKNALFSVYVKDIRYAKAFEEAFEEVFGKTSTRNQEKGEESTNKFETTYKENVGDLTGELTVQDDFTEIKPNLEELLNLNPNESSVLDMEMSKLDSFDPEIFELCRKLGMKIANKRSRRLRRSKRMRPDIRRSIRKNLKHGGVILEILRSRPNERKSQHIFLSDVSGSCDWISNWFFCIIYATQKTFHRSRFFDFDSKIVETTHLLDEKELQQAFTNLRLSRARNMMLHGTSDMYSAFRDFLDSVNFTGKSYIIILSDCRDWAGPRKNGVPESAEFIREMSERARKVLILNPEPANKWDVVDSCVSVYRDAGASIKEVRTLRQLGETIESL